MTIKEIIDGLKFTVDMFLFDPSTGEVYKEPQNDMDKTTIDACRGAIELLEQTRWIPVSERLPEEYKRVLVSDSWCGVYVGQYIDAEESWGGKHFINEGGMHSKTVKAWQPLPESYKASSTGEEVEE